MAGSIKTRKKPKPISEITKKFLESGTASSLRASQFDRDMKEIAPKLRSAFDKASRKKFPIREVAEGAGAGLAATKTGKEIIVKVRKSRFGEKVAGIVSDFERAMHKATTYQILDTELKFTPNAKIKPNEFKLRGISMSLSRKGNLFPEAKVSLKRVNNSTIFEGQVIGVKIPFTSFFPKRTRRIRKKKI